MRDKTNATLQAALRVLTAIMEGAEPEASDAEVIRSLFPACSFEPLDELACKVVRMSVGASTRSEVAERRNRHAS